MGSGTLTLTGANNYTGGTRVRGGALRVSNTEGSGTGTGDLEVDGGIFGGSGTISGAVTIGNGSGARANLQPGFGANKPVKLTLQNALTFKSDGTYTSRLNTNKAKSDKVVANWTNNRSGGTVQFYYDRKPEINCRQGPHRFSVTRPPPQSAAPSPISPMAERSPAATTPSRPATKEATVTTSPSRSCRRPNHFTTLVARQPPRSLGHEEDLPLGPATFPLAPPGMGPRRWAVMVAS